MCCQDKPFPLKVLFLEISGRFDLDRVLEKEKSAVVSKRRTVFVSVSSVTLITIKSEGLEVEYEIMFSVG